MERIWNNLKHFAENRNRVAVTSFLMVVIPFYVGDILATIRPSPIPRPLFEIMGITSLVGGIVFFIFGSRYARKMERRRQRIDAGQCVKCSYDLSGNVSGICPECGTLVRKETN